MKNVQDSKTEQVYVVCPKDINPQSKLSGGRLIQWIDELGGIVGRRHSGKMITTAKIDNIDFIAGAQQNDMIVLIGKVTYVGNTSMEVRVDTYIEDYNGNRKNINTAYLVMVALDENGNPAKVPELQIKSELEKKEWLNGQNRYNMRKQRKVTN